MSFEKEGAEICSLFHWRSADSAGQESSPLLQITRKPEVLFLPTSLISLPCHQISECCTSSRDMLSGLPSLATASYLPSQEGFPSKDQDPHNNSMRCISEVQKRGHTPFSALLWWSLEQPRQKLLPQGKGDRNPPVHRKEKFWIPIIPQIYVRYHLFHASYIFLYKI